MNGGGNDAASELTERLASLSKEQDTIIQKLTERCD